MSVFIGANNIISALGFSTKKNVEALLNEKIAVQQHQFSFSESDFCCAKINEEQIEEAFQKISESSAFTQLEKMCILSILDVINQSEIDLGKKENLLIISTTKGNIDVLEKKYIDIPENRAYLTNFTQQIGNYFHCINQPLIVSNACISGVLAIVIGKRLIEAGKYKNIIVCGADIISEFTLSGFKSFNALSSEPSKPFDKNRIGINLGEAAASVLLSSDKISNIEVIGGSSANDANHISGPSRTGEGLFKAVSEALTQAKINEVDFISGHGTATEYNDEMESIAFSRAHLNHIPIHSLKGYYGHTLGAAGVLESIIALEALKSNVLIQSYGFNEQGTSEKLNVIPKTTFHPIETCLKTASGFGGCNAAVIYKKTNSNK